MQTTDNQSEALRFSTARELVEAMVRLKDAGQINGYSIHGIGFNGQRIAGVAVGDRWAYLKSEA